MKRLRGFQPCTCSTRVRVRNPKGRQCELTLLHYTKGSSVSVPIICSSRLTRCAPFLIAMAVE
ncbi:MAG: hypothetical protein IH628_14615 [Proteobacteria bacterium]|nr:hypothetical protein [Pseudomonadota bacterium]